MAAETTQPTPGPWRLSDAGGNPVDVYDPNNVIIACAAYNPAADPRGQRSAAEQTANARLMAAAPDMLAALEAIAAMKGQTLLGPDSRHNAGPGAPRQYEHGANAAFGQAAQIASAAIAKAVSHE